MTYSLRAWPGPLKKTLFCFWAFGIVLICAVPDAVAQKCPTRLGSEFSEEKFLVIAHIHPSDNFPDNTFFAFQEALSVGKANALEINLFLLDDGRAALSGDGDPLKPRSGESVATFHEFFEWATRQNRLQLVLVNLKIPIQESHRAPVLMGEVKRVIDGPHHSPHFQFVFSASHREVIKAVRNKFNEYLFSYDQEIPPEGIINYNRFTTVPKAMNFRNDFAGIGLPVREQIPSGTAPDPWLVYLHVLTLDFRIRDNYKKSTSNYIKIISRTFNDEKKIRCLINLGVNGIVTDKPERLRQIALDMGKKVD